MTSYTTIISAQELSELQATPSRKTVVIDCRFDLTNHAAGREAYAAGHLPGAYHADLEHDLAGEKRAADGSFRGRHPLPEKADWLATLRGWGIDNDTQIVACDAHGGMFAARLWWMARWAGHAAVAVLDGGMGAWRQQGKPVTTEVPATSAPGNLVDSGTLVATVTADRLLDDLRQPIPYYAVTDARSPDRYRGENETLDAKGGHIPGAKNRFFKDNLQADGRFKPAEALKEEWQPLWQPDRRNVMQCGSGVTACHNLLALEIAGLTGASLYPGSWSEWSSDDSRPVATGAEAS